jgi:hypothetical protein
MSSGNQSFRRSERVEPWERAFRRAEKQHGVISRKQLLTCGVTSSAIQRRLAGGMLIAEHPGVYRWRGSSRTSLQQAVAALLAVEGSVLSHGSAAAAWNLPAFTLEPIHLTACVDPHSATQMSRSIAHENLIEWMSRVDGGSPLPLCIGPWLISRDFSIEIEWPPWWTRLSYDA